MTHPPLPPWARRAVPFALLSLVLVLAAWGLLVLRTAEGIRAGLSYQRLYREDLLSRDALFQGWTGYDGAPEADRWYRAWMAAFRFQDQADRPDGRYVGVYLLADPEEPGRILARSHTGIRCPEDQVFLVLDGLPAGRLRDLEEALDMGEGLSVTGRREGFFFQVHALSLGGETFSVPGTPEGPDRWDLPPGRAAYLDAPRFSWPHQEALYEEGLSRIRSDGTLYLSDMESPQGPESLLYSWEPLYRMVEQEDGSRLVLSGLIQCAPLSTALAERAGDLGALLALWGVLLLAFCLLERRGRGRT